MGTFKQIIELDKKEIIKHVKDDFKESQSAREQVNLRNMVNLKAFHCIEHNKPFADHFVDADNNPMPSGANSNKRVGNIFYPPYARATILSYHAVIMSSLFPDSNEWFDVIPNEGFDASAAEAFEPIIKQLLREIEYTDEADLFLMQALLMDVSVMHFGWAREPGYVQMLDKEYGTIDSPDGKVQIPTHIPTGKFKARFEYIPNAKQYLDYTTIHTMNLRVDPAASSGALEKSNPMFLGFTDRVDKASFYRRVEAGMFSECELTKEGKLKIGGKLIDDEEECGGPEEDSTIDFNSIVAAELRQHEQDEAQKKTSKNHFRVDYYWQKYGAVVVVNGKYLASKRPALGWEFAVMRSYPIQGKFSGWPVMNDLVPIQHDINTMVRSRRNRQDGQAYPKKFYDSRAFDSDDHAEASLNSDDTVVKFDGGELEGKPPVFLLEYHQAFDDTVHEQTMEVELMETVSGVSQEMQGSERAGGRKTAREAGFKHEGTVIRTGKMIEIAKKEIVKKPVEQGYILLQIYSTKAFRVRTGGRSALKYVSYTKEDFVFRVPPEIKVIGRLQDADLISNTQIFLNALQFVSSNPLWATYIKQSPHLQELYRRMGIADPERFLHSDKPTDLHIDPGTEIQMLIKGIEAPISPANNPNEHFQFFSQYIESEEFDELPEDAQDRVTDRALEYHTILSMAGGQQPGGGGGGPQSPEQLSGANSIGGMITGGTNPAANPVAGQANQMAAGTPLATGSAVGV